MVILPNGITALLISERTEEEENSEDPMEIDDELQEVWTQNGIDIDLLEMHNTRERSVFIKLNS